MSGFTPERIERILLQEFKVTRYLYLGGQCSYDEYAVALKRLNDFLLDGIIPNEFKDEWEK